ncbi:sensor histidine kinase [Fulvivirga lutea]|uniref:histidine kinase n=1 Tax=Fulvivirga lutea TaxID=2810512 RepID=A0A975A1X7_9BACT|nr:ATP-binding protein [Fulvivirga lutea]QSE98826.1 PAS domain-containing protein [Fulvivirga lutea]
MIKWLKSIFAKKRNVINTLLLYVVVALISFSFTGESNIKNSKSTSTEAHQEVSHSITSKSMTQSSSNGNIFPASQQSNDHDWWAGIITPIALFLVFTVGFITNGLLYYNSRKQAAIEKLKKLKRINEILEKRIAEQTSQLNNDKKELEIQSNKLNLALQVGNIGIWDWDLHSGSLEWDSCMLHIFNYQPHELNNSYEDFANRVHPEDLNRVKDEIEKSIASHELFRSEFRLQLKNGDIKYLTGMGCVIYNDQSEAVRMIGTNQDVTHTRLIQKKLELTNEQLEEKVALRTIELAEKIKELEEVNADLRSFSYSVSHDLRAPLRALSGFSDALYESFGDALGEKGNRWVNFIKKNAAHMDDLIEDILALSRTTQRPISKTVVDMKSLALTVFEENKLLFPNVKFNFQVDDLENVSADAGLMKQLWQNLISNAMKYSSQNENATITISNTVSSTKVTYSIKDNGVGFDDQYKDKLFVLFQRLHSSAEFEGTGIGLTIAKKIVVKHGGEIWGESKGQGATFYFSLPLIKKKI